MVRLMLRQDRGRYAWYNKEGGSVPALDTDSILSAFHLTVYPAGMPFHPDVLRVRKTGTDKARTDKGHVAGDKANLPLPSLGRTRLRPRTLGTACRTLGTVYIISEQRTTENNIYNR